jgi:hypothetical protein
MGVRLEGELHELLVDLRASTTTALEQWSELKLLFPAVDNDQGMTIVNWCMAHSVDSKIMSYLLANSAFAHTNYGVTRQSFWSENDRVTEVLGRAGYDEIDG